jgi:hypothetical protein
LLKHIGKYLVVPTTTGIKLKESLLKDRAGLDPAATAQNAAASLTPLVRENDAGEMVFTGNQRTFPGILTGQTLAHLL